MQSLLQRTQGTIKQFQCMTVSFTCFSRLRCNVHQETKRSAPVLSPSDLCMCSDVFFSEYLFSRPLGVGGGTQVCKWPQQSCLGRHCVSVRLQLILHFSCLHQCGAVCMCKSDVTGWKFILFCCSANVVQLHVQLVQCALPQCVVPQQCAGATAGWQHVRCQVFHTACL